MTHLMSSQVDFVLFSIKSVSFGAIRSNTTLRMLDFPALKAAMKRESVERGVCILTGQLLTWKR